MCHAKTILTVAQNYGRSMDLKRCDFSSIELSSHPYHPKTHWYDS